MNTVKAFDVSAHSGEISQEKANDIAVQDYKLGIVQLWGGLPDGSSGPNPYAESQLRVFRLAGMYVAGYIWLPPDDEIETNVLMDVGLQAAGAELPNLRFVALDIEGTKLLHPTDHVSRLLGAVHYLETLGQQVVIYTSASMWQTCMNNDLGFSRLPLWDAIYDQSAGISESGYPYGGWTYRAAKQYTNTTSLLGVNACLDTVDLEDLHIESEEDVLRQKVTELEGKVEVLKGQLAQEESLRQLAEGRLRNLKTALKLSLPLLDAVRGSLETYSR